MFGTHQFSNMQLLFSILRTFFLKTFDDCDLKISRKEWLTDMPILCYGYSKKTPSQNEFDWSLKLNVTLRMLWQDSCSTLEN